jgi:hypothetical protein
LEKFLVNLANLRDDKAAITHLRANFPEFFSELRLDSEIGKQIAATLEEYGRLDRGLAKVQTMTDEELKSLFVREVKAVRSLRRPPQLAEIARSNVSDEIIRYLGICVADAWAAADPRVRDWQMFTLRMEITRCTFPEGYWRWTPPPSTPLEQALNHLQREWYRARHCPGRNCVARCFFASRKGQKFCSEPCSALAKAEAKRRWWKEHRAK